MDERIKLLDHAVKQVAQEILLNTPPYERELMMMTMILKALMTPHLMGMAFGDYNTDKLVKSMVERGASKEAAEKLTDLMQQLVCAGQEKA